MQAPQQCKDKHSSRKTFQVDNSFVGSRRQDNLHRFQRSHRRRPSGFVLDPCADGHYRLHFPSSLSFSKRQSPFPA